jgi:hypothetical protein
VRALCANAGGTAEGRPFVPVLCWNGGFLFCPPEKMRALFRQTICSYFAAPAAKPCEVRDLYIMKG